METLAHVREVPPDVPDTGMQCLGQEPRHRTPRIILRSRGGKAHLFRIMDAIIERALAANPNLEIVKLGASA